MPEIELTIPQFDLVFSPFQFPAMVAGFGSGKTNALVHRNLAKKFEYPTLDVAYYLPTYDLVSKIAYPRFREVLAEYGYRESSRPGPGNFTINKNDKEILINGKGKVILRTMDSNIIGYEVADSCVDELDTLKEEDARTIWRKVLARNRQKKADGKANTIAVGTTPEGFRFVYNTWKKKPPSEQYVIIKASTHSNARNLPDDYIQSLIDNYPSNLIEAYINGEFVNLTQGRVYPEFDRKANGSLEVIKPGEPLFIGMDFNVGKMAAVVFVKRGEEAHAVGELTGLLDTPAMIRAIKLRFANHAIYIYPDASGGNRSSKNASTSDLQLLREAKFQVLVNSRNPFVRDRVVSMNTCILNGEGIRRLKVNANACPSFTEGLEKQPYDKNGEPDKTSGLDHAIDAGGYFITFTFPVISRGSIKTKMGGV